VRAWRLGPLLPCFNVGKLGKWSVGTGKRTGKVPTFIAVMEVQQQLHSRLSLLTKLVTKLRLYLGRYVCFLAKYVFPGTLKPAFDMDNDTSLRAFLVDTTEQCPDRCKGRHDALCESTRLAIPCLAYRECIQDAK